MKKFSLLSVLFFWCLVTTFGFYFLIVKNLSRGVDTLAGQVGMVVFLKGDITDADRENVTARINKLDAVSFAGYVPRDAVLEEFKNDEMLAGQIKILEENPLPAIIDIRLKIKTPEAVKSTAQEIKSYDGVEDVRYTAGAAEGLESVSRILSAVTGYFGICLAVFAFIGICCLAFAVPRSRPIFGIVDSIAGALLGYVTLFMLARHVFMACFKKPVFLSETEILIMFTVVAILGIAVRIPKNVMEN
jgi:hypothetical protein